MEIVEASVKYTVAFLIIFLALLLKLIGVIVSFRTYDPEPSRLSLRHGLVWDLMSAVCIIGMMIMIYNSEALGLD